MPTIAAIWTLGTRRWRGLFGIRFFLSYPPLWTAVLFGSLVCLGTDVVTQGLAPVWYCLGEAWVQIHSSIGLIVWLLAVVLIAAIVSCPIRGWNRLSNDTPRNKISASSANNPIDEFDLLKNWLRDDQEIESPESDRFGHDEVARRVANRIGDDRGASTLALVGRAGSGKSSIRALVQYHLREQPKIRLVPISLWPFDTPEAAVHGILAAAIRELSRHVNVLPLGGIPDEYLAVIEKAESRLGVIAPLLRPMGSPDSVLGRVSEIALATGLRIVLWIEDFERFARSVNSDSMTESERDSQRLGAIRALLYQLDRCNNLSVVVADVSLRSRFDIDKIARYVEHVPEVGVAEALRVINLVREQCKGGYPIKVIDPTSDSARGAFTIEKDVAQMLKWIRDFRDTDAGVTGAIVRLARTPRTLKSGLRLALEVWEAMPGEVELDAVIVASIIRTARPEVFALLDENALVFQKGLVNPLGFGDDKKKPHNAVNLLKAMLDQEDSRTGNAIKTLISYVFPAYPPNSSEVHNERVGRPQGLFISEPTNYWQRYLSQDKPASGDSDQSLLQKIKAWRQGLSTNLIDDLANSDKSGRIEQFVGQFEREEIVRLLDELIQHLAQTSAADWEDRAYAPGLGSLIGMMRQKPPAHTLIFALVSRVMRERMREHLPLINDLFFRFAGSVNLLPDLITGDERTALITAARAAFISAFTSDEAGDNLILAAHEGYPGMLIRIVSWLTQGQTAGGQDLPFVGWERFARGLLDAAERQPQKMIPYLIPFVALGNWTHPADLDADESRGRQRVYTGRFDEARARRLFEFDRLTKILARSEALNCLDPQLQLEYQAAVIAARAFVDAREN